jgi:S1-C subfamily serine protease
MPWICPSCGRRVPTAVTTCRCGTEHDPSLDVVTPDVATPHAPAASTSRGSLIPVVAGLVVTLVAVGGVFYWMNMRQAPNATPTTAATPPVVPTPAPTMPPASPTAAPAVVPATATGTPIPPPAPSNATAPSPAALLTATAQPSSLEDLISRSLPAVVRVETGAGLGTGFFVRPDTILTNAHVVQGNVSVTIRRPNGETLPARVENMATEFDIAVLHIDTPAADQATIPLGSGSMARAGQEVVALGSPLGLQNTVTRGIVSAVRQVSGVTLVQTDAAINPGNSGGPLIDRSGAAIGITTMTMRSAVAQGLSFAVAIDHAADLLAGKRPTSVGTPVGNLNQAMHGATTGPSEAEVTREQATKAYDQALAQLARRADSLDDYWRQFRSACYEGRVVGSFDREWFALFDQRAMQGAVSPGCGANFGEIRRVAFDLRDQVLALEEAARRADVFPGSRRDARRKYRLDYSGWDR